MKGRREFKIGIRLMVMALVFLAMSCESDGGGDGCLGSTDGLITGCTDGCGTGMTPIGDGCLGSCIFGGDGGCNDCGAGEGCSSDCLGGSCGDCGNVGPYSYDGPVVQDAIQVNVTDSLFQFVNNNIDDILATALGDSMPVDSSGYVHYCMEPTDVDLKVTTLHLCSRKHNCNVDNNPSGPHNGCDIKAKVGDITVSPQNGNQVKVHVSIDGIKGSIGSNFKTIWNNKCTIKASKDGPIWAEMTAKFILNTGDNNLEFYLGGDTIAINRDGLKLEGCGTGLADFFGIIDAAVDGIVDGIGALSCRGCNSNADCGDGGTCKNGTCRDGSGRMCQGIQMGMEAGIDAGSLLQQIDPSASAAMGLKGYLGPDVNTKNGGLQLYGRLGGVASPSSLCVPKRPQPVTEGEHNCRTGEYCDPLSELLKNKIHGEPYHLGLGIAMSPLNEILWAAYSSGALCLSIGGDSDALGSIGDFLNTGTIGAFVTSLGPLTYGTAQPLMLQLRPQYPPEVDFQESEEQGAEINLSIPDLAIDFYTVIDQRYARLFTLNINLSLPLGIKADNNQLNIAIGDLTEMLNEDSITVSNVKMVSQTEVETLIGMLPDLISTLAGTALSDAIPPIDIPEVEGFQPQLVGPGVTVLDEKGKPAMLGIFAKVALAGSNPNGLHAALQPEIQHLDLDVQDPRELRAFLAEQRAADQPFGYKDLMPHVVAHMGVTGADVDPSNVQYAYRINDGLWSFWQSGPDVHITDPRLATQDKYTVQITARVANDPTSGSASDATFSFVNDYTAPTVRLQAEGSNVAVKARDNVYDNSELTMQYRFDGEEWSDEQPLHAIDVLPQLLSHHRTVLDVFVKDPSGNARAVRQTFGQKKAAQDQTASDRTPVAGGGCSSGQNKGGLIGIFLLLGMLFVRRRRNGAKTHAVAASPAYMGIAVLAILLFAIGTTGCKKNGAGAGDSCDPECQTNEICKAGVCEAATCDTDDECPGDGTCIDGRCAAQQHCRFSDDCDPAHICLDGICAPSQCNTSAECSASACSDGTLPYCDYDDYVNAGECLCMDGLPMRNYGTWLNVLHLDDGSTVALTYNEGYGDLMFGTLNENDNFDWNFIDGVPDGPVLFPPTGLRGGIKTAGDDAGRYVSAVVQHTGDGDVIHAVYQYVSKDDNTTNLRYARGVKGANGWAWNTIDVDTNGVSGMFPSITLIPVPDSGGPGPIVGPGGPILGPATPIKTLDADNDNDDNDDNDDGMPTTATGLGIAIVYMTGDVSMDEGDGEGTSHYNEVSTAWAPTTDPQSADDFAISEGFDQASQSCAGLCPSDAACLQDADVCVPKGEGCTNSDGDEGCDEGKGCVTYQGNTACLKVTKDKIALGVVPAGVGLFSTSVVDDNDVVHTAYYDQKHGVLKYVTFTVDNGALQPQGAPLIVDGQGPGQSNGDVGRWGDIHLMDNGDIVIFYQDAGKAELRAAVIDTSDNVSITTLDDGHYMTADQKEVANNRVGSSVVALPLADGGFEVVYQDATDGDARRVLWTDMTKAPSAHPYPIFGIQSDFDKDLVDSSGGGQEPAQAVTDIPGAYGYFVQFLHLDGKELFASKRIGYDNGKIVMDVQTGTVDTSSDGEGGGPVILDPNIPVVDLPDLGGTP